MTATDRPAIDVQIACDDTDIPSADEISAWVERALADAGRNIEPGTELSVRVVDKEDMRALNRDYRQKDKATNVLSFPAGPLVGLPADMPEPLGDIVVCAAVVSDEAVAQGKTLLAHWAHMLVHGTLHLLGYDHETETQAADMEALERKILTHHGLTDPYGASHQRTDRISGS